MTRAIATMTMTMAMAIWLAGVAQAEPVKAAPVASVDRHRTARAIGVGVALGLTLTSELVLKDTLAPGACRWCTTNRLDDRVHGALTWGDPSRAALLSNISGVGLVPLSALGLLWRSSRDRADPWGVFGDDVLAIAESAVYSVTIVQIVKFSVGRQRPYAHDAPPASAAPSNDDNLSFPSGHSALTFSIATTAGLIAHARHDRYEPVIWATGMTLAATTAYLRIAAEKHYLTDVLAGGALGVATGLIVPRITGALPRDVVVVPTGNGVALSGAF